MVNINLTFFIQLVLFLVFMWGANRLAFRPILRILDKREETIGGDETTAEQSVDKATRIETEYAAAMQEARRDATIRQMQARRSAMDDRGAQLSAHHRQAEEVLAALHAEAERQIEAEQPKYAPLVTTLVEVVEQRLNLKVLEQ